MTATPNIVELLANAGPEINDHVIALHHELAQLREVLRTTHAQMMAEREVVDRAGTVFERMLNQKQQEVDSLREARRQLKARVRQLEEGGPLPPTERLDPLRPGWATHVCGTQPCLVVATEGSYSWVLYHPQGRPRTRLTADVKERLW